MTSKLDNILNQISEVLDIPSDELSLDMELSDNDKWDSFAILASVALVTKNTGKQITMETMRNVKNVGDLVSLIKS
ncbi:acyl carrier protein [Providencia stuartii]|uniref:acyl carrier protein n=1 Tax=Providencia stuartii TaxID=588 RepID=UPI001238C8A2|nr:acyl carrier protein [Providencia stuartii]MDT7052269.1 acyl carrier protein [Providencia stuartii]QET97375.1 acyl carrier protein [Providencia stuartii]UQZ12934.1 acyl carrier protein [Providencia stuartii]HEM8145639.1 acyl carrier protein [Providencia stuartii]HEM8876211.1 acyl carrier protein [Providencia stuartii]